MRPHFDGLRHIRIPWVHHLAKFQLSAVRGPVALRPYRMSARLLGLPVGASKRVADDRGCGQSDGQPTTCQQSERPGRHLGTDSHLPQDARFPGCRRERLDRGSAWDAWRSDQLPEAVVMSTSYRARSSSSFSRSRRSPASSIQAFSTRGRISSKEGWRAPARSRTHTRCTP